MDLFCPVELHISGIIVNYQIWQRNLNISKANLSFRAVQIVSVANNIQLIALCADVELD